MSASTKLLRIVSQQRRMAALAYGQAVTHQENLERGLTSKRIAISKSEENLSAVMRRSNSISPDKNEPAQTVQALTFYQCELERLNSLAEVTRNELEKSVLQTRELRENYEVLNSREEALEILIQKDELKRRVKRIQTEQTNLDEMTIQRWGSQTV